MPHVIPEMCHGHASQPYTKVSCNKEGVQDVSPSCQWEQQALSGVGTDTMVGRPAQTALVLVNVRDVCHCFINVQMLPNKEAQVGPEMPVRADGAERWVRYHPRGEVMVGPREHFTILCSCTRDAG